MSTLQNITEQLQFSLALSRKSRTCKAIVILISLGFVCLLQGALNPDAEASVTERYYQLKDRLRSELEDTLQTRTEQLDQEHAALEYVREKAELLLSEAKVRTLLTNVPNVNINKN